MLNSQAKIRRIRPPPHTTVLASRAQARKMVVRTRFLISMVGVYCDAGDSAKRSNTPDKVWRIFSYRCGARLRLLWGVHLRHPDVALGCLGCQNDLAGANRKAVVQGKPQKRKEWFFEPVDSKWLSF